MSVSTHHFFCINHAAIFSDEVDNIACWIDLCQPISLFNQVVGNAIAKQVINQRSLKMGGVIIVTERDKRGLNRCDFAAVIVDRDGFPNIVEDDFRDVPGRLACGRNRSRKHLLDVIAGLFLLQWHALKDEPWTATDQLPGIFAFGHPVSFWRIRFRWKFPVGILIDWGFIGFPAARSWMSCYGCTTGTPASLTSFSCCIPTNHKTAPGWILMCLNWWRKLIDSWLFQQMLLNWFGSPGRGRGTGINWYEI